MIKISFFLSIFLFSKILFANEFPTFDIHFAVLTKNDKAHKKATLKQLKKEVDILNKYFVSENKDKLINFRFKSASFYKDIKNSKCKFIRLGDTKEKYNKKRVYKEYFTCKDIKVRDTKAINIYVIDSYSPFYGYDKYTTSRGAFNKASHPFILLDWKRLNHTKQSPEEHEMGHCFGLGHVCVKDAKYNSDTNIMSSSSNCKGSGGQRNIGFNKEQVSMIKRNAKIIKQNFNLEKVFKNEETITKPVNNLVEKFINNGGKSYKDLNSKDYQYSYMYDNFRIFYSLSGKDAIKNIEDKNKNLVPDKIESLMYQLVFSKNILENYFLLKDPLNYSNSPFVLRGSKYIDIKIRDVKSKAYTSNKNVLSRFSITKKYNLHRGSVISMTINKDFKNDNLIPFHEMTHIYQNAKTRLRNDWFSEGSSRWLEYSLENKKIKNRKLPKTQKELLSLFSQGYNAASFWNSLGKYCEDSENLTFKKYKIPEYLQFPKISNGFKNTEFYKSLLDNLQEQSIYATKAKNLNNYLEWPAKQQKSKSNNIFLLKALTKTIKEKCQIEKQEINSFINLSEKYLRSY
ncbi:hypothetical protein [Halarcobacter sp.]|uniref:hypothetical protein n=1 Tax=Halarcobacter sp. TaxID=2321133 RepID=UPI002AA821A8|nr:hypothetical protein [Halarcobacter sp.]